MTRLEENETVIREMHEKAKHTRTYNEMVVFQLATIAAMLADISKSFAILADKTERNNKE